MTSDEPGNAKSAIDRKPMASSTKSILVITNRCPYPPVKGDKIHQWNLLKFLKKAGYQIHLATFIDDPEDLQYREVLVKEFASCFAPAINPRWRKIFALHGLLTGAPLSTAFYHHPALQRWIDETMDRGVDAIIAGSSAVARFIMGKRNYPTRIIGFADIDSDKWTQYSKNSSFPLSWIYSREGKLLFDWERKISAACDIGYFVTKAETAEFRTRAPEVADRVATISNGVDSDYFDPAIELDSPYPKDLLPLCFTGAMDYKPNIDAVVEFVKNIFPLILQKHPRAAFWIVGSKPSPEVQRLAVDNQIFVTGRVPDVRPYLKYAKVVVSPIRIARGLQNKVLEGMAMEKTVVGTPECLHGIHATPEKQLLLGASPKEFADQCSRVVEGLDLGKAARQCVLEGYSWYASLSPLQLWIEAGIDRSNLP
jgi:sugar transferase (PEP-CTERM/EpsH1 system associated)